MLFCQGCVAEMGEDIPAAHGGPRQDCHVPSNIAADQRALKRYSWTRALEKYAMRVYAIGYTSCYDRHAGAGCVGGLGRPSLTAIGFGLRLAGGRTAIKRFDPDNDCEQPHLVEGHDMYVTGAAGGAPTTRDNWRVYDDPHCR